MPRFRPIAARALKRRRPRTRLQLLLERAPALVVLLLSHRDLLAQEYAADAVVARRDIDRLCCAADDAVSAELPAEPKADGSRWFAGMVEASRTVRERLRTVRDRLPTARNASRMVRNAFRAVRDGQRTVRDASSTVRNWSRTIRGALRTVRDRPRTVRNRLRTIRGWSERFARGAEPSASRPEPSGTGCERFSTR
jgi:hypothetical protein